MSIVTNGPRPIDIHVCERVRLQRKALGFNQETLAIGVGLTFQKIQKYEHGANRISASKLWAIARVLRVPVAYFFEAFAGEAEREAFQESRSEQTVNDCLVTRRA
jgi:transcriptional regulator with XRE-family HTH domain